jgi:hypothetical protein
VNPPAPNKDLLRRLARLAAALDELVRCDEAEWDPRHRAWIDETRTGALREIGTVLAEAPREMTAIMPDLGRAIVDGSIVRGAAAAQLQRVKMLLRSYVA